MSVLETYIWIAAGVATAVVFPVLRNKVAKYWPPVAGPGLPIWAAKYLVLLAFSLVTALIVLAVLRQQDEQLVSWWAAYLAGFAWESFWEKIGTKALPAA